MKINDFKTITSKHIDAIYEIIKANGICEYIGCSRCPFRIDNSTNSKSCFDNNYTDQSTLTSETDEVLIKSCTDFLEMIVKSLNTNKNKDRERWITFKYKMMNTDLIITKQVNLNHVECINYFDNNIEIVTPMRFENDCGVYTIRRSLNDNFDKIKEKINEFVGGNMRSIKLLHDEIQKVIPEFFEEDNNKLSKLAFKIVENDFFKAPEAKWQSFDDYYNTIMIPIMSKCMDKHKDSDKYVKCISIFSTKPEEEIRRDLLGEIE